jgi:uncharacterized coiled-coil protein SlyX
MPTNREHIERLISAHKRRLEDLEIKAATYGTATPPEITTEIEDIRLEIAKLQASVDALTVVNDLRAEFEPTRAIDRRDRSNYEERLHIMVATVQATVAEFSNLRSFVHEGFKEIKWLISRLAIGFSVCFIILLAVIFALSRLGVL